MPAIFAYLVSQGKYQMPVRVPAVPVAAGGIRAVLVTPPPNRGRPFRPPGRPQGVIENGYGFFARLVVRVIAA